jgi:hypothetical protein
MLPKAIILASVVPLVVLAYGGCGGSTLSDAFSNAPVIDGSASDAGSANETSSSHEGGAASEGGVPPSVSTSCNGAGDCVLGALGCCGVGCGQPTTSSYVAIQRGQESALRAATCTDQNAGCPDCATILDPSILAVCRDQECKVVDLREDPIAACQQDADCVLIPSDCCPCGLIDVTKLVAVGKGKESAYRSQVCDPGTSCSSCNWNYEGARAHCTSKHCEVDRTK